jgi:hypothetical protein
VIVLRLAIAALSALILADCGGMHACTSDGIPCGEQAVRPAASARSSGGSQTPALLPTASASVASAPFVPPAAFEAPAPAAEAPPPAPTATVTETTVAAVEEPDEDSGRHHGRHGRHGSRRHRSSGSHSRHHRHH